MTDPHEFPRLTFDPSTGRVPELGLSEAQYTTLVAMARCPVVLPPGADGTAVRCSEPLLLPCAGWTSRSGHGEERTLTGDWLCANNHGPADYVSSPGQSSTS